MAAHVNPGGLSDNVFRSMEPGQAYDIEIAIPTDHTAGTYWYHPHQHGSADIQITGGMAGALIIEGDFDDVPEVAAATERVLIVNEVLFDYRGTIENYDTVWPEAVPRFLAVNGQREPVIRMRPGEVQRWRIIQAAHEDNLHLALEGHALHAIAYDGIRRAEIEGDESLVMAPGQRADILVKAGSPGTYRLQAIANDQGYPSPVGPLARLVVEGEPMAMALPTTLGSAPLATIRDEEITNKRRLWLSSEEPESPASANYQEFTFLICGRRFDPDRVDQSDHARRRRGVARRQRGRERPRLPHPYQSLRARRRQRRAGRRAGLARHRGCAAQGQRHLPFALPRFHRQVCAPLPHDEPRGARHDAGRRGARRLTDHSHQAGSRKRNLPATNA